ncbi:uncharacterized protein LOC132752265 [Ruditapes philippinarum]|uniref:uncharacterized protein LOC132752265 n=1 Tax=Ruditapes philippinarum TaxID=129788 RepID=UPI00295AAA86|nr:uncharacterized protein LOC132752265 [Ruditapes philippinarum]
MNFVRVRVTEDSLLFISLLICAILPSDSTKYYVTFLGRNVTTSPVGVFLQKLTGTAPGIKHDVGACTPSASNWGISSDFTASQFDAPDCGLLVPNGTEMAKKGIKVESVDDFTLHVIQTDSSGSWSDGYIAIPYDHLGATYYVITYCATGGVCQFAILATDNYTKVEVTFSNSVQPRAVCINGSPVENAAAPGTAIPFELNELDVLHFESENDLSGTYISADKNIAVVVGARDIPKKDGTTSHVVEQIPPIRKWGTEFVVVPNILDEAGDIVKIVTQKDNTVIYILGYSPVIIPKAGDAKDFRIDWKMHTTIHSSEPVLLIQVMNLNLYNSSNANDLSGSSAMVIVPHIEQWVDTEHHFQCAVSSATNESLIAVVAEPGMAVLFDPTPSVHYSPWESIQGSQYEVLIAKPSARETSLSGGRRSMYGFCEGQYAVLLGVKWDWENELCKKTISSPGDDVDNDCDGEIDEDTCTDADFSFNFTASQTSDGTVTYKIVNAGKAGHIDFTVSTCDIAVVTLRTTSSPHAYITVKISPTSIVEEICVPKCFPAAPETNVVADCINDVQYYSIEWFEDSVGLKHVFHTDTTDYYWDIDNVFGVDYEELVLSAMAGSAAFVVDLPDKDCSKMISETADAAGRKFIIPVSDGDSDFTIILTTRNDLATTLNIQLNVDNSLGTITMTLSQTLTITKGDITEPAYSSITVTSTNGELMVYLLRSLTNGIALGLSILPSDILGPTYLLFIDSVVNINDDTAVICEAVATDRATVSNSGEYIGRDVLTEITNGIYSEGNSYLGVKHLSADRPLAVFCGNFADTLVQMPPKETLGTEFFIPSLDLSLLNAVAEIHVVITEDSTVLVIGGDYDQMDPVDFTGDFYIRTIEPNTIYNITASKPVQVHLEMRSTADSWASAVVIPPTTQYRSSHVFPGFSNSLFGLRLSSAVDQNGLDVPSLVTSSVLTGASSTTLTYAGPTFCLSVLGYVTGHTGKKIVVSCDVLYADNNEICIVSNGTAGDGVDNDCDGLIDEEYCSDSREPGTFDYDIDGSLNEDCSANSTATGLSKEIAIPLSMLTCSSSINNTNTSDPSITIGPGAPTNTTPTSFPTLSQELESEATYDPIIASTSGSISVPTTAPATGNVTGNSSAAPVNICVTECVCPCGWVNPPQNYTPEELAEIVEEIQEKLKVSKAELSSTIRKKSSAPDDRPSATAVGYVGLASIIFTLGAMALLDITTVFRDVRVMIKNLREYFQP